MKHIRLISASAIFLMAVMQVFAQPQGRMPGEAQGGGPASEHGQVQRVYTIGVKEVNESLTDVYALNRVIEEEAYQLQNRPIGQMIFNTYRALASDKIASTMTTAVDMGISFIANSLKSHRGDWQKAVENECRFTKVLSMNEEISDFYMEPSEDGALALNGIAFRGFSCSQKIRNGHDGQDSEVFNVEFQLDTTREGIRRMLQHSKFQMKIKSIRFNPYLCEIPNDSTSNREHRIPFDFNKRKDFTIRLNTVVKSSWVNEAILITKDQTLGEFMLEIRIDPEMMKDSCFTYDCSIPEDSLKLKQISLTGESFMVPRSYIGKIDDTRLWGTGQYRLEMTLSESCRINEDAYMKTDRSGRKKWDRKAWNEEWKVIKRREKEKKNGSTWKQAVDKITMTWKNGQWFTEIVSPCTNLLIQEGVSFINEDFQIKTSGATSAMQSAVGQSAGVESAGKPAGMPAGQGPVGGPVQQQDI